MALDVLTKGKAAKLLLFLRRSLLIISFLSQLEMRNTHEKENYRFNFPKYNEARLETVLTFAALAYGDVIKRWRI